MSGTRITPRQRAQVRELVGAGWSIRAASEQAGIHYNSGKAIIRGLGDHSTGQAYHKARAEKDIPVGPLTRDELCRDALESLDDFAKFRARYIGRLSTPWQEETAHRVVELAYTPQKEFVVENVASGTGKSTLLHDISCWMTARDRRIRGCHGSRIENNARRQIRRIRRSLERVTPPKADATLLEMGLAIDAVACMAKDYGTFKPITHDIWAADEFVVAQFDDAPIEEKEPTWSSYGMDSGILGNRFKVIFWDDLVDKVAQRTAEALENQREWWDSPEGGEARCEPGGLVMVVGQRFASNDLYRYCLDKKIEEEDGSFRPLYHHIVYKAHDESKCRDAETHKSDAPAWPEGCLIDPYRLPWRDLRTIRTNKRRVFMVSYQQEDVDPEEVLVKDVWLDGGLDPETGEQSPGCIDDWRIPGHVPPNLADPVVSMASVDPSGKKAWSVGWWLHSQPAELSYLIDLFNESMPANELLDWNAATGEFYGLMEDWQKRSVDLGRPITHWIVEINAAQRYLLAYDHVRRWMAKWRVSIIPHTTTLKKLDPDVGPWIMREKFRHGQIRLPGHQSNRRPLLRMREELTRWPNAGADDNVMQSWFFFANLPKFSRPEPTPTRLWRPRWMRAA